MSMEFMWRRGRWDSSYVAKIVRRRELRKVTKWARVPNSVLRRRTRSSGQSGSIGRYQVCQPFRPHSVALTDDLLDGMPHFFKRCAVTRDLFNLIIEFRPSLTSGGLSEHIKRELRFLDTRNNETHQEYRTPSSRISQTSPRIPELLQINPGWPLRSSTAQIL